MQRLYLTQSLRAAERAHAHEPLMARAGAAVAALAGRLLGGAPQRVCVLAGGGNNGGDGAVCARLLRAQGHAVHVVRLADAARLPADARAAWDELAASGGSWCAELPGDAQGCALVVDALLGIGLTRAPEGAVADAIAWAAQARAAGAQVLALDVPSGLVADSGHAPGAVVQADATITFMGLKPGLVTGAGVDCSGALHLDTLGIDAGPGDGRWLTQPPALPPPRARSSHKGSHGSVAVAGGGPGMAGAALLAGQAALLAGAGKVHVGFVGWPAATAPFAGSHLELMQGPWEQMGGLDPTVWVVGPGMGQGDAAAQALGSVLARPQPLVLDADALNLLAASGALRAALHTRAGAAAGAAGAAAGHARETALTPHPGEAARLLAACGEDAALVQTDRIAAARRLAAHAGAWVALKGAGTVVASPAGAWAVNASGNPLLAAAGMGDTLAGLIGALAAQGLALGDAVATAVHLHGAAADALAARQGDIGATATELAHAARECLNRWTSSPAATARR